MKRLLLLLAIVSFLIVGKNSFACNGFTPAVTNNTYIGNGQYLLTIDICEFVSNSDGLGDFAFISGLLITVNGANIDSIITQSITGITSGLTVYPSLNGTNQVEYGDWGNQNAPVLLAYGDPQECWTIQLIVDGPATSVDVWGSSSESVLQPGFGMVDNNGTWGCGSGIAVPPAVCDASWNPPTLCAGSSGLVDLDTTTLGTGTFSGPGVTSGTGIFDPTGFTNNVPVTFTVGDAFFNCSTTMDIQIINMIPPNLTDSTICLGDDIQLDAAVTPPPPPPTPCTYSIGLFDTWGDGWNGGTVTVLVDGTPVLTAVTLASGSGPVYYDFNVMPGQTITVTYSGGSFQSENYYTVYDGSSGGGSSLFSSTVGAVPPASQNVSNPCTGGPAASGCNYTLVLEDSFGDGWNGADIDIYINGVPFLMNQTVPNCGTAPCVVNINIPVSNGDVILLNYSGGTWDSENTIYLYDNNMALVNSINNPPDGNLGSGITAVCPVTTMNYSWSPPGGLSNTTISNPVATIVGTTTYTVNVTQPGLGCSSTTNVTITVIDCSLPVELVSFEANCNGDEVELSWRTVSEINNDYFIVEQSDDAVHFNEIARIDGYGTTQVEHEYSYTHHKRSVGTEYFRLRQVDYNGLFEISNQLGVNCSLQNTRAFINEGNLIVQSDQQIQGIHLIDATGRSLYSGENRVIDVSRYSSSIFFVKVEKMNRIETIKVVSVK